MTAIPSPIRPKPINSGTSESNVNTTTEPTKATNPEYRAVVEGPNFNAILSPVSLIANIQIEKTVNPKAALPLESSVMLLRKIALQSATMPSPSEAQKVIKATGSKAPFGIEINGALLSFSFFIDLKGMVTTVNITKKIIIEVIVKCIGIPILK